MTPTDSITHNKSDGNFVPGFVVYLARLSVPVPLGPATRYAASHLRRSPAVVFVRDPPSTPCVVGPPFAPFCCGVSPYRHLPVRDGRMASSGGAARWRADGRARGGDGQSLVRACGGRRRQATDRCACPVVTVTVKLTGGREPQQALPLPPCDLQAARVYSAALLRLQGSCYIIPLRARWPRAEPIG